MFYYQHHIGDFIKATSRLTDAQAMAYLRMVWAYYDDEKPFPNDIEAIAFRVGAEPDLVSQLVKCFFDVDGELIRHRRCDEEIAGYRAKQEGGKKGAAKRWGSKDTDGSGIGNPLPQQSEPNANHKPITDIRKPTVKSSSAPLQKPSDVEADVWLSFLAVRKQKRAAVTDLAVLGIRRESVKAGISLNKALTICCERGWASFKADWDWQGQGGQQPRKTQYQINQEGIARSLGLIPRNDPPEGGTIIEGDTYETTARLVDR